MNPAVRSLLPSLFLLAGASLHANTLGYVTPSFRGQAGTEFGLWDNPAGSAANSVPPYNNFTIAYSTSLAAPGNVVNNDGPADPNGNGNSDAVIRQLVEGAFITGLGIVGNIYSPTTTHQFNLSDGNSLPVAGVVFQTRTVGTELDYASVKIAYDLGNGAQFLAATRVETDRSAQPGGEGVSSKWEFDLRGLGINSYSIVFNSAGPSTSFDSAALDVQFSTAVPEPQTYALMLVGGLACFAVCRRRSGPGA